MSITAKRLKNLLAHIPDDAEVHVYDGEDTGISFFAGERSWFVRCRYNLKEADTYTEGFEPE